MFHVTIRGSKSSTTYQAIGSIEQVRAGAAVKSTQLALTLGSDRHIRIKVTS